MLQDLQILACLTVEEATNLEMFCQERSLEAGEVLFYEDEEANAMYFLKSGAIDIVKGQ
ncbi:MAG: cyclic nucleotide-binding domain-containing protein [Candidatus Peribacteria bacterium]|nr:MAG: cyclic nucleotide-binding domain-containing protein [Candidatus Peribacteria bacterium]